MNTERPPESRSVEIANQIIDFANQALAGGDSAESIASGLRHAAANFSAFTFFGTESPPKDPNAIVEEYINFFEHYLNVHKEPNRGSHGLEQLVEQVKKDF